MNSQYYKSRIIENVLLIQNKINTMDKQQIEMSKEYTDNFMADLLDFTDVDSNEEYEFVDDLLTHYLNIWEKRNVSQDVYNHINKCSNENLLKTLALEYKPLKFNFKL